MPISGVPHSDRRGPNTRMESVTSAGTPIAKDGRCAGPTLDSPSVRFAKSPGFALTVIATLALCIGVNTAVFSVLDAVLLRPVPYPQPDHLALVVTASRSGSAEDINTSQTGALFEAVRDHAPALDTAAHAGSSGANFSAPGRLEYVQQQRVSSGFFRVLGIAPWLGREFTREEDVPGGPALAVLSYGFWQRVFRGDPAILGKAIQLKGEPHVVIGVMPRDFRIDAPVDVWTPLRPSRHGRRRRQLTTASSPAWRPASPGRRPTTSCARSAPRCATTRLSRARSRISRSASRRCRRASRSDSRSELLLTWAAVLMVLTDRLREHRGTAAGALRSARSGDRDPHGVGRQPRRDRAPTADGERDAGAGRRGGGHRAGRLCAGLAEEARRGQERTLAPDRTQRAGAGCDDGPGARHQPGVRPGAGARRPRA